MPQDLDASQNLDASSGLPVVIPEDVPCCVCNDREYQDDDQIILCDGCDLAIHQGTVSLLPALTLAIDCQGLKFIPAGLWLCDRCAYFKKIGKLPDKALLDSPLLSPLKVLPP